MQDLELHKVVPHGLHFSIWNLFEPGFYADSTAVKEICKIGCFSFVCNYKWIPIYHNSLNLASFILANLMMCYCLVFVDI